MHGLIKVCIGVCFLIDLIQQIVRKGMVRSRSMILWTSLLFIL